MKNLFENSPVACNKRFVFDLPITRKMLMVFVLLLTLLSLPLKIQNRNSRIKILKINELIACI